MAGTIDAGELKVTVKLFRENMMQGLKELDAAIARAGGTAKKTGKDLGGMGSATQDLSRQLAALGLTFISVQQAVSAFTQKIAEDTAFNRVVANMKRLGVYTPAAADSVERLTFNMEYLGGKQTELFAEMMPLLTLTKDVGKATGLLSIAQRASISTGTPLGSVVQAITDALQSQERTIRPLLRAWGEYNAEIDTAGDFLEIVGRRAGESAEILSAEALSVIALKKSFDDLKESMSTTVAPPVTAALRGWAMLLTTISYELAKVKIAFTALPSDLRRSALVQADLKYQEQIDRISGVNTTGGSTGAASGMPGWWEEYLAEMRNRRLGTGGSTGGGKPAAVAPFDYAKVYGDYYDKNYGKLADSMQEALDEIDRAWQESTATWREGIDKTADSLGYLLIDLPFKGKDAWRSFIDSMLSMLRELAAEFISTTLKAQGLAWLRKATGWVDRSYEDAGNFVGPHSSGLGGPTPIGPGMGGGMQPVYVTVKGDLTRYAEFKIVSTGLKQGRQVGF